MPYAVQRRSIGHLRIRLNHAPESIHARLVLHVPLIEVLVLHGGGKHVVSRPFVARQRDSRSRIKKEILLRCAGKLCNSLGKRRLRSKVAHLICDDHLPADGIRERTRVAGIAALRVFHERQQILLQTHGRQCVRVSKIRDAYDEENIRILQILRVVHYDGLHGDLRGLVIRE